MSEGTGTQDPVGDVLRGLFQDLNEQGPLSWTSGTCSAVLEALEDAVRPHRPMIGAGYGHWHCQLDHEAWPCPTYRQVQDTLEGLL